MSKIADKIDPYMSKITDEIIDPHMCKIADKIDPYISKIAEKIDHYIISKIADKIKIPTCLRLLIKNWSLHVWDC